MHKSQALTTFIIKGDHFKIILAAEWNVPSILAIFNQVNNIPEKGL